MHSIPSMSVGLSVCLSVCLFVCLSVCLSVCMSVCLSVVFVLPRAVGCCQVPTAPSSWPSMARGLPFWPRHRLADWTWQRGPPMLRRLLGFHALHVAGGAAMSKAACAWPGQSVWEASLFVWLLLAPPGSPPLAAAGCSWLLLAPLGSSWLLLLFILLLPLLCVPGVRWNRAAASCGIVQPPPV